MGILTKDLFQITNFPQTGRRYLVTLQFSYGSSGTGGYLEIYIKSLIEFIFVNY